MLVDHMMCAIDGARTTELAGARRHRMDMHRRPIEPRNGPQLLDVGEFQLGRHANALCHRHF
jgi:hypothetical protein